MFNPSLSHIGVVKENGFVDTSQFISDPEKFTTTRADDGKHVDNFEIGNFEWWYFDVFDPKVNCMLKLVVHLGTDPLRRKIFPQIAISVGTQSLSKTISIPGELDAFYAARDKCDVRINDKFYAFSSGNKYHLTIDTGDFKGEFEFLSQLPGWKPLGDEVNIAKEKKSAQFGWFIPVPKALVNGKFELNGKQYILQDALGYHDHNFWKVGNNKKLYLDDVISKWYWGRFFDGEYTIIIMDTFFRNASLRSLLLAKGDTIIHSSNNLISVTVSAKIHDKILKVAYPSRISVKSIGEKFQVKLTIQSIKVVDRKDLLQGIHPLFTWLIKKIVAKPVYFGLFAQIKGKIAEQNISGTGIYEFMRFRK